MKTKHYLLIGLGIFFLITALTNPGTEKHKEEVKLKLNTAFEEKLKTNDSSKNDQWSQAGNAMGNVLAKSMINMIVDNCVSSTNYILFSTTKVTYEGETKTIGIGLLGNIFLSGKIDEALKK